AVGARRRHERARDARQRALAGARGRELLVDGPVAVVIFAVTARVRYGCCAWRAAVRHRAADTAGAAAGLASAHAAVRGERRVVLVAVAIAVVVDQVTRGIHRSGRAGLATVDDRPEHAAGLARCIAG